MGVGVDGYGLVVIRNRGVNVAFRLQDYATICVGLGGIRIKGYGFVQVSERYVQIAFL